VLVVGGSTGKAGAAAMAGMAALKAGAGLSTVATAKQVVPTVAGFYPELMTEPLEETKAGSISLEASERVDELLAKISVLAVGPGISGNTETAEFVRGVIARSQKPTVLDADGLNAFHLRNQSLRGEGRQMVITPHPGEMARLLGSTIAEVERDRTQVARDFASEHGLIVVLKGHRTVVAKPDGEAWINATGNAGMATGGTGDILTGMVAALMAQHPEQTFEAVIAAVYLHGLAGDVARERMGEQSLVATDLIAAFPEAFRRTRQAASLRFVEIMS
jgi:NAD(P)H-hydrate epimerase